MCFSLIVGGLLGSVAGFFGGKLDMVIMRCMDILLAIPNILLAITIVAALGASNLNLIIALTISSVPGFSRIVRGAVLTVRDSEYIEAARAIGCEDARIILSHVLPNCMGPILVQTTLNVGSVILSTAGLSSWAWACRHPVRNGAQCCPAAEPISAITATSPCSPGA